MLTTFDRFLVVPIFAEMRLAIQDPSAYPDAETRRAAIASASFFDLRDAAGEGAFATWCRWHLLPEVLFPPRLSAISDLRSVGDADALESFASDLADIVVGLGPEGRSASNSALISSIRAGGSRLEELLSRAKL
jgi:hypothetical protein